MRTIVLFLSFTVPGAAQYVPSTFGSSAIASEINRKAAAQTGAGAPTMNCAVGKDFYTDITTGTLYLCTAEPNGWMEKGARGPMGATGPQGLTGATGPAGPPGPNISAGGSVTSVFGRTGAVTAQTGDYTAAQVNSCSLSGCTLSGQIQYAGAAPGGNTPLWRYNPADASKGPFLGYVADTLFGSTQDSVFSLGYNQTVGGGRVKSTEPSYRWQIEQDYEDIPGHHVLETYYEWVSSDGRQQKRPLFWQFDKGTGNMNSFLVTTVGMSMLDWTTGAGFGAWSPTIFSLTGIPTQTVDTELIVNGQNGHNGLISIGASSGSGFQISRNAINDWFISASGNSLEFQPSAMVLGSPLYFPGAETADLGQLSGNRPRNVNVAGSVNIANGSTVIAGQQIAFGSVNSILRNSSTGALTLATNGSGISLQPNSGIVGIGGIASTSFPALKRLNSTLAVRLSDDSADAPITASTIQTNAVFTVGTLPPCNAAAEGLRTAVRDALAPSFLATLTGGGSVHVPAYCNGTNWVAN